MVVEGEERRREEERVGGEKWVIELYKMKVAGAVAFFFYLPTQKIPFFFVPVAPLRWLVGCST